MVERTKRAMRKATVKVRTSSNCSSYNRRCIHGRGVDGLEGGISVGGISVGGMFNLGGSSFFGKVITGWDRRQRDGREGRDRRGRDRGGRKRGKRCIVRDGEKRKECERKGMRKEIVAVEVLNLKQDLMRVRCLCKVVSISWVKSVRSDLEL